MGCRAGEISVIESSASKTCFFSCFSSCVFLIITSVSGLFWDQLSMGIVSAFPDATFELQIGSVWHQGDEFLLVEVCLGVFPKMCLGDAFSLLSIVCRLILAQLSMWSWSLWHAATFELFFGFIEYRRAEILQFENGTRLGVFEYLHVSCLGNGGVCWRGSFTENCSPCGLLRVLGIGVGDFPFSLFICSCCSLSCRVCLTQCHQSKYCRDPEACVSVLYCSLLEKVRKHMLDFTWVFVYLAYRIC